VSVVSWFINSDFVGIVQVKSNNVTYFELVSTY
jgi:hypothetical protein